MTPLLCMINERRLAHLTVTGFDPLTDARIRSHLNACPSCRASAKSLSRLASDLMESIDLPEGRADMDEIVWMRIAAARWMNRGHRRMPAFAGSLAVAALLTAIWGARHISTDSGVAPQSGLRTTDAILALAPEDARGHRDGDPRTKVTRSRSGWNRHSANRGMGANSTRHMPRERRHSAQMRFASTKVPQRTSMRSAFTPALQQAAWERWGVYCESYGDYRSAAAAYENALRIGGDAALAFQAGRAAECGGDVEKAIDYYAQVLKQENTVKPLPEKGSLPWNDGPHTA